MGSLYIVIGRRQHAAQRRPYTQDIEIVSGHELARATVRLAAVRDIRSKLESRERTLENRAVLRQTLIERVREDFRVVAIAPYMPAFWPRRFQHHQLFRISDRQPPQQHLVQKRKDGRVRANSQRKSQNGDRRESRILPEHPQAIAHVLPDRVHSFPPQNIRLEKPKLLQPDSIVVVPLGHVGENHFVSDLQSFHHFDGVHRTPPQLYIDAHGFRSVINDLEDSDRAVCLAMDRSAHVKHILQILERDRAVHTQVRSRSLRQRVCDGHVHSHRPVLYRGIDSGNVAVHHSVPRIDRCLLPDGHVLRLRLRNLDFRFEFLRIGHPRQVCTWCHMLPHLHRHELQYAIDARPNMQRIHLALLQLIKGLLFIDFCLLRGKSRFRGIRGHFRAFALKLHANRQLFFPHSGEIPDVVRSDALFEQLFVYVMLQAGLLEITAHGGFVRLLVHQIAVHLHLKVCVVRFRAFELVFRVQRLSLQRWVAQFHNDGIRLDDSPRTQYPAFHSRVRLRRDPANLLGNQRPQSPYLSQHRPALHFVRPNGGAVHRWCGGPQPGKPVRHSCHQDDCHGAVSNSPNFLGASVGWSLYVHGQCRFLERNSPAPRGLL